MLPVEVALISVAGSPISTSRLRANSSLITSSSGFSGSLPRTTAVSRFSRSISALYSLGETSGTSDESGTIQRQASAALGWYHPLISITLGPSIGLE